MKEMHMLYLGGLTLLLFPVPVIVLTLLIIES